MKDFVFLSKNGNLIHTGHFRRELLRLVDSYNNMNPKNRIENITPHTLRHSGCTRNAENGMDMKVLQYLMEHKSSKITNQVYNHVTEERVMEEMLKTARNQQNRHSILQQYVMFLKRLLQQFYNSFTTICCKDIKRYVKICKSKSPKNHGFITFYELIGRYVKPPNSYKPVS